MTPDLSRPDLSRPEMSRIVRVDIFGPAGLACSVKAEPTELAAIAVRLGVPAVRALSCRLRLVNGEGGIVVAEGTLRARLVRDCVVSLEPFDCAMTERFQVRFVPAGSETDDAAPESDDEIPYEGGVIDIGEAVVEQLALDLDPYPRKPGAVLPDAAETAPTSAFAALAALRDRGGEGA